MRIEDHLMAVCLLPMTSNHRMSSGSRPLSHLVALWRWSFWELWGKEPHCLWPLLCTPHTQLSGAKPASALPTAKASVTVATSMVGAHYQIPHHTPLVPTLLGAAGLEGPPTIHITSKVAPTRLIGMHCFR